MKSNYKRIGDFIVECDTRNDNDLPLELWGVSIDKKFIKSVANVIGTDLSKYKIVRNNQFVCSLMQVSRDEKIPIDLWKGENAIIVSPAYKVFQVLDTEQLLPEYLNMWFRRSEFDREASYYGVGGVRGSLEWSDFCEMKLPLPEISVQRSIVDAYNAIERRISVKRKINDNLEASGITIVKECYGALNFITETKEEIFSHKLLPGWSVVTIKDFCTEMKSGATPSRSNPEYWSNGTIPWLKSGEVHNNIIHNTEEHITGEALSECSTKLLPYGTILMAMYGVTAGEVGYLGLPATTNQAICGMICKNKSDASWLFFTLLAFQKDISSQATGGAQSNLSKEFIERIHILRPQRNCSDLEKILYHIETNSAEINKLKTLQDLLLAKLSSR